MKNSLKIVAASSVLAFTLSGCASIFNGGLRDVSIASTPAGANVTITNSAGNVVTTNTTPFVAKLAPSAGYFKGETYKVSFDLDGHQKRDVVLSSTISGWYFGNILLGGLIGMLIVDPMTGAMFNLTPDKIEQPLDKKTAALMQDGKGIMVALTSQLTDAERQAMVPICKYVQ
jgi:hypothetical protein